MRLNVINEPNFAVFSGDGGHGPPYRASHEPGAPNEANFAVFRTENGGAAVESRFTHDRYLSVRADER